MQLRTQILNDQGGTLETNDGTLYVSKPYRSKSSQKLRAMVAFAPRRSHFDLSNDESARDQFRAYVISFEETGQVLSLGFATMFSRDAKVLALSDAVLVATTAIFCVPYAKALRRGWLSYNGFGLLIQHVFQTTLLFGAIIWTFNRKWPWVQSGFLTLHSLVMIMKVHSYIAHNGYLSNITRNSLKLEKKLQKLTSEVGGWDEAIKQADLNRRISQGLPDESTLNGKLTSPVPEGANAKFFDNSNPVTLRKRLIAATESLQTQSSSIGALPSPILTVEGHPLAYHPDQRIADLARNIIEMRSELVSSGPAQVRWPENISWANYWDYLLVPSLVYDIEFPRTDRVRPLYIFEKTVATFGTFALLFMLLNPDLSFADRQFYEDWWNATSWDEFARKWNKPVHVFLLRHVYASVMSAHRLSRGWATFWTFLLSAAVHELIMIIVTKKFSIGPFAGYKEEQDPR
ncbi:hypothetical protein Clacol_005481 [Clathrus columnatus]|uniref:O-acyltransferase n=1 Tax=Clathrus columnatus TaxID=1419009 RepID=A0AAV5A9H6_9AGAM|nr:hypothetical protein Clacol_005481 [Clathrus columnatus]